MRSAAGTKNIWVVGGGDLAGQFHDAGQVGTGFAEWRYRVPRRSAADAA